MTTALFLLKINLILLNVHQGDSFSLWLSHDDTLAITGSVLNLTHPHDVLISP